MAGDQFEKDFGYLMPFLDKVAEAASAVEDQAARSELAQLVQGEKQRWERIRQLLSGSPANPKPAIAGRVQSSKAAGASEGKNEPASPSHSGEEARPRPVFGFTVGSLKPRLR